MISKQTKKDTEEISTEELTDILEVAPCRFEKATG